MSIARLVLFVAVSVITFSCSGPSIDGPPVTISHRILDETGRETNVIEEGHNFVFSIVVTNISDEDWYVDHGGIFGSGFASLYAAGPDTLIGRPYASVGCTQQAGVTIPPGGEFRVEIPWIADESLTTTPSCFIIPGDQAALPPGRYVPRMTGDVAIFRADVNHRIPMNNYEDSFDIK